MSKLNEPDADTFFLEGDEGTYEGGPASVSIPAQRVEAEDERVAAPTAEQLERRERLRRVVTTVVGTLAAASLLLFSFRLGRVTSDAESASSGSTSAVVVAPTLLEPTATKTVPDPHADAVVEPPKAVAELHVDPLVDAPKAPSVPAAATTVATSERMASQSTTSLQKRALVLPHPQQVTPTAPSTLVAREPAHERRDPPTVSFPD